MTTDPVTTFMLRCQCCGIERQFSDEEDAFKAGWDAPPHFTGYICCDLCPAVCIVLGQPHTKAHALWAKEGRPTQFSVAKCGTDHDFITMH
jgi:hypothetical protein